MAWDLKINPATRDLTSGYVAGQEEILQRISTRLWRHLGEWFLNISAGLPWYEGPSDIMPGELTKDNAILGNRDFNNADLWIRNEIQDTDGVIRMVDFNTNFNNATREYSAHAKIATDFGTSGTINYDFPSSN